MNNNKALNIYDKWNEITNDISHLLSIKTCIKIIHIGIMFKGENYSINLLNTSVDFFGHCFDNTNNTLLDKLFSNTPIQNQFKELKVEYGLMSKVYKEIRNECNEYKEINNHSFEFEDTKPTLNPENELNTLNIENIYLKERYNTMLKQCIALSKVNEASPNENNELLDDKIAFDYKRQSVEIELNNMKIKYNKMCKLLFDKILMYLWYKFKCSREMKKLKQELNELKIKEESYLEFKRY